MNEMRTGRFLYCPVLKKVSNSLKALTMDARLTIIGCLSEDKTTKSRIVTAFCCLCWGISS